VVVDDLDIVGISFQPPEAYSPLKDTEAPVRFKLPEIAVATIGNLFFS
jgi:hypothetical protein